MFIEFILLSSAFCYIVSLLYFIFGLYREKDFSTYDGKPPVSVIIAVRNGEKNINRILTSLKNQTYNGEMEFIIVDDQSFDDTPKIINNITKNDSRFIYTTSKNGNKKLKYKKRALDAGINKSKNEILLFTDVDCIIQPNWVSSIIKSFNDETDYVIGFSEAINETTMASRFQKIDFFLLLAAARAMVNNKSPWACTGQNQAYRKSLYNQVGGFEKISNQLQGDDSLFLMLCRKLSKIKVSFATSPDSFVISRPELNWLSLIKQRIRWAGDSKLFWKFNLSFQLVAISTFLFNLLIIALPIVYGTSIITNFFYFFSILLKFMIELIFLIKASNVFVKKISIIHFFAWFIIQPLYICIVSGGAIFNITTSWENRSL